MQEPTHDEWLRRTYELVRENNRMLKAMRRDAFIGGVFKLIVWAAFIIIPLWLYMQYLAPTLNQAINTLNQVQGSVQQVQDFGSEVNIPISDLSGILDGLKAYLPENTLGQ